MLAAATALRGLQRWPHPPARMLPTDTHARTHLRRLLRTAGTTRTRAAADVAGASPVPAQMRAGASPVPAQMWAGASPVPAQMWQG